VVFNPAALGDVYSLAVQTDGKILAAGAFSMLSGVTRVGIGRLNASGSLDPSFYAGANNFVYSVALQPDGKILAGGLFTMLGGQSRQYIGRLNADGTVDAGFNPSANGTVMTLAIQADGKILAGGSFNQLNGQARKCLGRLNADGTLDSNFNPGPSNSVNVIMVQADGKILVGGTFVGLGGWTVNYLGRLEADGSVDTTFNPLVGGPVYSLALQADGKILVGGNFNSIGGQSCVGIARLNANGDLDTAFNPAANGAVYALALQQDGKVLSGGAFTVMAGQNRSCIARLSNTEPATQSLVLENSTLTWLRGGASPELCRAAFELTTNGTDWVLLGAGNPVSGGWQLADITVPANYAIRARGSVAGGEYGGSSWFVEGSVGSGPVTILNQPADQTAGYGNMALFTVLAAGSQPLAYQWRKDGQEIADATDSIYTINSAMSADLGKYSVCVSNAFGSVTSRAAWLTVVHTNMPLVVTQPAGPVAAGSATLNGMAVSKGQPTAAWFEWGPDARYGYSTSPTNINNGANVVRVSAPIDGLATGSVYHYRLVASNAFGIAFGADKSLATGMKVASWASSGNVLTAVPCGLSNIVAVACGHAYGLAIRSDGTVVAWGGAAYPGYTDYGQTNVPSGLSNVVAVAGGWFHSLALKQDGTVSAWGKYAVNSQPAYVPVGLSNVIAIAGGDSHSLALKNDGSVVAWGDNGSRQISVPYGLSNVVAIAAGSTHSLALKADGKVVAWGVGMADPTPPSWLSNVVTIASETWHNLALRADGSVVAWGANDFGQANVPALLSGVVAVAAGFQHSLALKADGTIVAWGNSSYIANVPTGLSNVVSISSGDYHSLALSPVNLPPFTFSKSVTGPVNNDLIVSLSASDPNGDLLSFRIKSPPTNGTLYQYTAAGRGDPIGTSDTLVSDPLQRVIFAPLPDTFDAPYTTFIFTASDGEYSARGTVTVKIVPSPAVQSAGFVQSTNRGFALGFAGLSNATYTVWASTNLVNWTLLGSVSQPSSGQFYFIDTDATNRPQRFYRVRSP
jgi:uncharacterized delta-60 repeat protein